MRLIKEFNESISYLTEESKDPKKPNVFIEGVFLQSDLKNKNGRIYPREIMQREVARYTKENVDTKRAYGELGHPEGPTVNLDRVSHMIVSLKEDGNNYIGKAKVMDTPMGKIVENLIVDGVKVGMSSRALGKLTPMDTGGKTVNEVSDMKLIAIDCVADPSYPDAFVNGILESKNWILNQYGQYEESFGQFENSLANLPKSDVESYIKEQIMIFINKLK